MLPPAPPRFSTITGWPRLAPRRSATMRPRMSVGPPGGNGRMSRMGLLGQASGACADAGRGASAAASATRTGRNARSFPPVFTTISSCVLGVSGRLRLGGGRPLFEELRRRRVLARAVVREARPRRNQAAYDDVLLESAQVVFLAHDGGFGEHARRLLEGGRGNERVGRQGRLGDPQQHVAVGRRLLAFPLDL